MGIAGPGDPFANPDETLETLRRVRAKYPEILLCVATNGLNLPPYLDELAKLKVSHVSITVNAVDPQIGAKICGICEICPNIFSHKTCPVVKLNPAKRPGAN